MKLLILLNIFFATLLSCGTTNSLDKADSFDKNLTGKWGGVENRNGQFFRRWEITRNMDGTFTSILFPSIVEKRRPREISGKWWTKNGKYFQQYSVEESIVENYKYTVVSEKEITFENTDSQSKGMLQYTETKE